MIAHRMKEMGWGSADSAVECRHSINEYDKAGGTDGLKECSGATSGSQGGQLLDS